MISPEDEDSNLKWQKINIGGSKEMVDTYVYCSITQYEYVKYSTRPEHYSQSITRNDVVGLVEYRL